MKLIVRIVDVKDKNYFETREQNIKTETKMQQNIENTQENSLFS
jgi:hypothetical protein